MRVMHALLSHGTRNGEEEHYLTVGLLFLCISVSVPGCVFVGSTMDSGQILVAVARGKTVTHS